MSLAALMSINALVLHGSQDHEISPQNAFLFDKAFRIRQSGSCEKALIDGADHTFASEHGMNDVIAHTKRWLQQHVRPLQAL